MIAERTERIGITDDVLPPYSRSPAMLGRIANALRETIEIARQVTEGGDVSYDGDVYEVGGLGYDREPPGTPPPIDAAALGPKAVELVGRFGHGWVPQLSTPDGLRDRLEQFLAVDGLDAVRVGFVDGMSPAETVGTMDAVAELA